MSLESARLWVPDSFKPVRLQLVVTRLRSVLVRSSWGWSGSRFQFMEAGLAPLQLHSLSVSVQCYSRRFWFSFQLVQNDSDMVRPKLPEPNWYRIVSISISIRHWGYVYWQKAEITVLRWLYDSISFTKHGAPCLLEKHDFSVVQKWWTHVFMEMVFATYLRNFDA